MERRIVSVWLPRLPTDRLNRTQNGAWADRPLAVVQEISGRAVLVAVNGCAEQGGAAPGMSLADARALCPVLSTLPVDPAADQALLERLADWCLRYTPWVAMTGPTDCCSTSAAAPT